MTMDGIELEILWSNLIGIVSEQAKALQRIAQIDRVAGFLVGNHAAHLYAMPGATAAPARNAVGKVQKIGNAA